MVTAAVWDAICTFLGWLVHLFPTIAVPTWVNDIGGYAAQGVAAANGFHAWVPLEAMRNGFVFLLSCGGIVLAVRAFRILLSLFTGGGGGAA